MAALLVNSASTVEHHAVISERHRVVLRQFVAELDEMDGIVASKRDDGAVLLASRMKSALQSLGTVTGRAYSEDLLTTIFSKFCIGK
jgi:tRNA modification GTPase